MSTTPTQAEIIMQAIDSRLLDVHTALPGKVNSFDKDTQTVEVELQVRRMVEDASGRLQEEELPILPNVPVGFPRSEAFFISFPLAKGDFVWVIFSEASIDQWRSKGSATPPGDARRHTLTGAVAMPCVYPNDRAIGEVHASAMVVGEDGGQKVFIHPGGEVEVTDSASGSAGDFVSQAGKVLTLLNSAIDAAVAAAVTITPPNGDGGTAGFTAFKNALAAADVASSNLKSDD